MPKHVTTVFANIFEHLESNAALWRSRGHSDAIVHRTYLEFGVWNGFSMIEARRALELIVGKKIAKQWKFVGFDSFEGLPEAKGFADRHRFAKKGAFLSEGQKFVEHSLLEHGFKNDEFDLVEGFFETTLTEHQYKNLGLESVSFVNIDVDYYSSTAQALKWVRPLLVDGSIVYLDDVLFYNGNPNKGQLKAVSEFNNENSDCGLYQAYGLDPLGRVYIYWTNDS